MFNINEVNFTDLLANNSYKIVVKFDKDLNNGTQEVEYVSYVRTKAYKSPSVIFDLYSDKTSIKCYYYIEDPSNISKLKDITLYYNDKKQDNVINNKTFDNLYSDSTYKVRVTLLNDYHDGNGPIEEFYDEEVKTEKATDPTVKMDFTSKVDSIKYNVNIIDADETLEYFYIDVYDKGTLVKTIYNNYNDVVTDLESNTLYQFVVRYTYNLNDDYTSITRRKEFVFSTLAYNVSILKHEVINGTTPKTNEDVNIKFYIDNKSNVKVDYLVINGENYLLNGGDGFNTIVVIVRSPRMSGIMNLNIEKMGYTVNNITVEQEVDGNLHFEIEIFSRLDILDISLVNGTNFDKSNTLGYVLTIDNPKGYKVIELNDKIECKMIDNNHIYLENLYPFNYNDNLKFEKIKYIDETGKECTQNITIYMKKGFSYYDIDSLTNALLIKQISTPEELLSMGNGVYELINDIDMSGYSWEKIEFGGYLDGKGHTISNITYIHEDKWEYNHFGSPHYLFDLHKGGTIKNVYFKDIFMSCDTTTTDNLNTTLIKNSNDRVKNVLFSGHINLKYNGKTTGTFSLPSTSSYIVDNLTVNNEKYKGLNLISSETFNSKEFKENTLNWVFKPKTVKEYNGLIYTIIDNSYIMITGYKGTNPNLEIPSKIDNLPVVGIEDLAFENNLTIKSIIFPESLCVIGSSVLNGCYNIESINLGNTKNLRYNIYRTNTTASIEYFEGIYIIGELFGKKAYDNSYNSMEYYYPLSLTDLVISSPELEERFMDLRCLISIKNVIFNGNFTCGLILSGCENLEKVTLPKTITYIDDNAFNGCKRLIEIDIPESVKVIGRYAFDHCESLLFVTLHDGLKEIFDYAFTGCSSLNEIIIPNSVTNIGKYAFYICTGLINLTLSESLRVIPEGAFSSCSNLSYVKIPNSVTELSWEAFSYCINLSSIDLSKGLQVIDNYALNQCNLKNFEIPESVIRLGSYALALSSMIDIIIPKTVIYIGYECFGTNYYGKIFCEGSKKANTWDYNWYNGKPLWNYFGKVEHDQTTYIIFKDHASVRKTSNKYLHVLDKIVYNNKEYEVTEILDKACFGNYNITELTLPNTLNYIGEQAFEDCAGLKSVVIPGSVKSIPRSAFYGCSSLNKVTLEEGVEEICENAFSACNNLFDLSLPSTLKCIGKSAFKYSYALANVNLPESLEFIGERAFEGSVLNSITIPSSVKSLGCYAFSSCIELEKVIIEEGLEYLDWNSFEYSRIGYIDIPSSVKNIINLNIDYASSMIVRERETSLINDLQGEGVFNFMIFYENTSKLDILNEDLPENIKVYYGFKDIVLINDGYYAILEDRAVFISPKFDVDVVYLLDKIEYNGKIYDVL